MGVLFCSMGEHPDDKLERYRDREMLKAKIWDLERRLAEKDAEIHRLKNRLPQTIHILSAEDNPADRQLLSAIFQDFGEHFVVHFVCDGEEALDFLFKRGKYWSAPRPNLTLLDLNLPKKDGRDVLRVIRQSDELKDMPVLILTTSASEEDRTECTRLLATAFITKPVNFDEYRNLLSGLPTYCH